ncbi:hypothetical protein [Arthrobacter rhombi]|uniref:hypothetical protein n=1 Tax=Arthrobacter rhombi TaxID=71253 RepID=UPI003FD1FE06
MFQIEHLSQLGQVHNADTVPTGGPHRYQYAIGAPSCSLPLDPDAAVAHLRELVFYHRHHSALYRARALTLRDEVLSLRERVAEPDGNHADD